MRTLLSVTGSLVLAAALAAQTPPTFEVASIRPSSEQTERANIGIKISGSQLRITYLSVRDYLSTAYAVRASQIVGPDWLGQLRFDIAAKIPDGVSTAQVPEMLRALLVERFELKAHRATQEFPVYALTVKDAAKLAAIAAAATAPGDAAPTVNVAASGSAAGLFIDLGGGSSMSVVANRFELLNVTTAQMADSLTRMMDRPVIDQTSLTGRYTVKMDMAPEDYSATLVRSAINNGVVLPPQAMRALDFGSADPFSPVFGKYGLALDQRRANLDVVVVDSMRKTPIEN